MSSKFSQVGIKLLEADSNGTSYWIGPLIAEGGFGAVHHVVAVGCDSNETDDSIMTALNKMTSKELENGEISGTFKTTEWVAKVVPVPKIVSKKKNEEAETAFYQGAFRSQCGILQPNIPLELLGNKNRLKVMHDDFGVTTKYRCLIVERMKSTLFDALPALVGDLTSDQTSATGLESTNGGSIDVGSIAVRLVRIAEATHSYGFLLVDVKPDNIMVAFNRNACSKLSSSKKAVTFNIQSSISASDILIDRIRLVDLGLVRHYKDGNGHIPNTRIKCILGTPQYASLNVHDLQTPSRRDDIESLLYITSEIIIRVHRLVKSLSAFIDY